MNIVSFFIPFLFTVYTRLQNKKAIAHYLFTFPLAWTIVTCFEPNFEIFRMFLSFIYFYSIYEFGYLQNDCETIKTSPAFLFLATILPPIQAIERSFPDYCAKQYYALPPERYVK